MSSARASRPAAGDGAPSRVDVCVVGGGPAGLLLGLLLAKRGAEVIVLEGHPTFDREFRGEVLQPSTPRLLEQIGLLEYILEQPHLTLTSGTFLAGGRRAAGFEFKDISPEYPYAIWMPQPVFLEAFAKKARPFAGFACWMGAHVNALVEEVMPRLQRRLFFGVPLPPLDPAFGFRA